MGALGLALLILSTSRLWRLVGLIVWAAGCGALVLWLAPSGHHRVLAAAALLGVAIAVALAWLFGRVPWLLPVAVLACAPARIPVTVGATKANLLLPLYGVVAAAVLALAWQLLHGDGRSRELGPFSWPLALVVAWTGIAFSWTDGRLAERDGAIYLLFFVLPFGLLAVVIARLPWRIGWVKALYVQLALMALGIGLIGIWQYATRNVFWNPKVIVDNAYAPLGWYYRVNSVFYDPSIYGRFLVVGDHREPRRRALRQGPSRVGGAGGGRRDVARARTLVLAVELRRAGGRDRRRPHRALAAAGGRAARVRPCRTARRHVRRAPDAPPRPRQDRPDPCDRRSFEARLARRPAGARSPRGRRRHRRVRAGLREGDPPEGEASEGGRLAHDADHGRRRDGRPGLRALLLADRRRPRRPVPAQPRHDRDRARPAGLRTSLDRDQRAQPVLQRPLRGPALLGPDRSSAVAAREPAA